MLPDGTRGRLQRALGIAYYLNLCDFNKIIAPIPADAPKSYLRLNLGYGDAGPNHRRSGRCRATP
jgi:hypothetical protein